MRGFRDTRHPAAPLKIRARGNQSQPRVCREIISLAILVMCGKTGGAVEGGLEVSRGKSRHDGFTARKAVMDGGKGGDGDLKGGDGG